MQLLLQYVIGECADCGRPIYFGQKCGDDADYVEICEDGEYVCRECRDARWGKCEDCGEWFETSEMTDVKNHGYVCDNCLENGDYTQCEDCGEWFDCDETYHVENFGHVCQECFENGRYFECDECGRYFKSRYRTNVGGNDYCEDCADHHLECDHCGEDINTDRNDCYTDNNGDTICEYCYEEHYFRCDRCEDIFPIDESYYDDESGHSYCGECYEHEHRHHVGGVLNYHDFKDNNLYRKRYCSSEFPEKTLFYGVELECDDGSFDSSDFKRWKDDGNLVHFEHDGSLSGNGVECITQPCTLLFHQRNLGWEKLTSILKSQGFKSHSTSNCGLHIHVGRSELSPVTITKMDVFINHAFGFFSQIARRDTIYNGDYDEYKKLSLKKATTYLGDRYTPVNTTNLETIEIRIFKGTLKWETLVGTIEMVDALVHFLEYVSVGEIYDTQRNVLRFIDYCGSHFREYTQLMPMLHRLVKGDYSKNVEYWMKKIELIKEKEQKKCA